MPHDMSGYEVKVGDRVLVPCKVVIVNEGQEYCNVVLETEEVMFPGTNRSSVTLNAKQVMLDRDYVKE